MDILKLVKRWQVNIRKYLFTYEDGFYRLEYIANSPDIMIKTLGSMPFVKKHSDSNVLSTKNLFCEGELFYQELESGFWIVVSEMNYTKNVSYNLLYIPDIPCNYYALSFNQVTNDYRKIYHQVNHEIEVKHFNWTFFKPGKNITDSNFSGAKGFYITLYFDENWLNNNLLTDKRFVDSGLKDFIASEEEYLVWPDTVTKDFKNIHFITDCFKNSNRQSLNLLMLKVNAIELILSFINVHSLSTKETQHYPISNKDRLTLLSIERYLSENLHAKFDGIEALAKRFYISPTKLKSDFKLMFGQSINQYFRDLQMDLAKKTLEQSDISIKEMASKLGYESPSKFSIAFKSKHGILPSELHQNN